MESLLEVFRRAPDPRGRSLQYRIGAVPTIVAMALLCSRREFAQFDRFAKSLSQPQRQLPSLPLKRGCKAFWQVPSYSVFYDVLARLDADAFELRHRATACTMVRKGGEYCLQIKANQPALLGHARKLDALPATPFAQTPKGHGRLEHRALHTFAVEAQPLDFPFARSLIVVRSQVAVTKTGRQTAESRIYLSSLRADARSHAGWHALLRVHWAGVEIRNQWRRDAVWGEARSLTRNPTAMANLALLRCAWLARDRDERSLPELIESFAVAPPPPSSSSTAYEPAAKDPC